jgi:hypothetical protein
MPPPGSPPVTMWVSASEPGSRPSDSRRLARCWAKEAVPSSVSASPARRPKTTRSVSPGPTGTERAPIRLSTKWVWPATKGPAPKVLSTELCSWIPVA